jgi:hypothetical protein
METVDGITCSSDVLTQDTKRSPVEGIVGGLTFDCFIIVVFIPVYGVNSTIFFMLENKGLPHTKYEGCPKTTQYTPTKCPFVKLIF